MRVNRTTAFKRDYKQEKKGRHGADLDDGLLAALRMLVADEPLPPRYHDHALTGDWKDHRDCHIKPDLADGRPRTGTVTSGRDAGYIGRPL